MPTNSSNSVSQLPLLDFENLDGLRIDAQHHVFALEGLPHLAQLDVDLVADRRRALDHAGGLADGAGNREGPFERLLDALAGNGDQAKVVEL